MSNQVIRGTEDFRTLWKAFGLPKTCVNCFRLVVDIALRIRSVRFNVQSANVQTYSPQAQAWKAQWP